MAPKASHTIMSFEDQKKLQKETIARKVNETLEIEVLKGLEKALDHYLVLHEFVLAKVAAGHEVPKKRITQLGEERVAVVLKTREYLYFAEPLGTIDYELLEDVLEGSNGTAYLVEALENPEPEQIKKFSKLLKDLVQGN